MINLSEKVLTKFHRKIINGKDVLRFSEVNLLGTIPESNTEYEKQIRNKQCMNVILNKILFVAPNNGNKVILIENCSRLEDNNWISVHIAVSLSAIKKKVLFVIPDVANIDKEIEITIEAVKDNIKNTSEKNLDILTNINLIDSLSDKEKASKIKKLIVELKKEYDFIIINTPTTMEDSVALSSIVDSTVLIANSKITKTKDLVRTKNSIHNVGGHIIGAILNKQKVGNNIEKNFKYSDLLKDEYSIKDSKNNNEQVIENETAVEDIEKLYNIIDDNEIKSDFNIEKNENIINDIDEKEIKSEDNLDVSEEIETKYDFNVEEKIEDEYDLDTRKEIEDEYDLYVEEEIKSEVDFNNNEIDNSNEEIIEKETIDNEVKKYEENETKNQSREDEKNNIEENEENNNKKDIDTLTNNQDLVENIITEKIKTECQILKNDIKFELQMEIADKINEIKTELGNIQNIIKTEIRETMKDTEEENKTEIESICKNIKENMQEIIRVKEEEKKRELDDLEEKIRIEIEEKIDNNKALINNMELNIESELEEKIHNVFLEKKELLKEENEELISKVNTTESIAKNNKEIIEKNIEIKKVLEEEINKAKEEINNLKKEIHNSDKNKLDFKEDLKQEILNEIEKKELQKAEKKVFSIHENIDYKDLEKNATYIIPLK